ncbi:MAG: glycosyltransferase family 39 protein [Bryobacteraceae bacterium]
MPRSWLILPLSILYLVGLGRAGFLGPDEPRYASIGREMAQSRDFVTPRLDGQPWFEKPPLLYWMVAGGRTLRLPDEWAARLPVALASLAFLLFFFATLQREFSPRIALAATAILATSVGWLAYSSIAVTDLPMSAAFGAAMLIAMFDTRRSQGYVAGALLGLAMLAKGFVPLVLFVPLFAIARGKRLTMLAGCVLVAAPWHLACLARNGEPFWRDYFWKQHVERFFTPVLQHEQPFWFYLPVILAGIFPWTPLAGLLARRKTYDDSRVRFLIVWLIYALAFFSAAKNKLPGYVLPMLPALTIVLAVGLEKSGKQVKWWLAASVLMLAAVPMIAAGLPAALLSGIRKAPMVLAPGLTFIVTAAAVWWLGWREKTRLALIATITAAALCLFYLKIGIGPVLDRQVSVREFWRANRANASNACVDPNVRREWQYGLNYYAGRALPVCASEQQRPEIASRDGRLMISDRR